MGGDNVGRGERSPALLTLPAVMPGLVPGIHVPPPPRPLLARTAMPQGVDARNKSGHDGGGNGDGETPMRLNSRPEPVHRAVRVIPVHQGSRSASRIGRVAKERSVETSTIPATSSGSRSYICANR